MKTILGIIFFFLSISTSYADINTQMQSMFGTMVNATNPQAFHGQMAGGVSGGSLVARNKIMNTSLLGFVPPRVTAGCGGIDMFGGSFSFINAAQFTQFIQSVASNAQGYFFNLALQSICGDCLEIMSDLQKQVQKINNMMSNSCETAKTLVDSANSAAGDPIGMLTKASHDVRNDMGQKFTTAFPGFSDAFESKHPSNGQNTEETALATNPTETKKYLGNIAWIVLKGSNLDTWFLSGGDASLLEVLMSFTGTTVTTQPTGSTSMSMTPYPSILGYKEMLYGPEKSGGTVEAYRCTATPTGTPIAEQCLTVSTSTISNFKGFSQMVRNLLVGTDLYTYGGLVGKLHAGVGTGGITATEQAFLENVPTSVGKMLREMSIADPRGAITLSIKFSPVIAAELATQFFDSATHAMSEAMVSLPLEQKAAATGFAQLLQKRRQELFQERVLLKEQLSGFQNMYTSYQNMRLSRGSMRKMIDSLSSNKRKGS